MAVSMIPATRDLVGRVVWDIEHNTWLVPELVIVSQPTDEPERITFIDTAGNSFTVPSGTELYVIDGTIIND